jgi:hypothetical protein
MRVIDSAASSFRDRLIEIIEDRIVRKKLGDLKESNEFIQKLVEDYIDEIAPSFENVPIMMAKYKKLEILGDSAISLVDCVDYAYLCHRPWYFIFHYSNKCGEAGGFIIKGRELIKEKNDGVPPCLYAARQTR